MTATLLIDYRKPISELQAVNIIMEAIGQTPVISLESAHMNVSAEKALRRLGEALVETSEEGWHFNTLPRFKLDPQVDGTVTLPTNTLRFVQGYFPGTTQMDLVQRDNKLFDRVTGSFHIGTSVVGDITQLVDFDQCPQAFRWYVTIKAARRMVASTLVSSTAVQFSSSDEGQARLRAEQADSDTAGRNLRQSPFIRRMRPFRR